MTDATSIIRYIAGTVITTMQWSAIVRIVGRAIPDTIALSPMTSATVSNDHPDHYAVLNITHPAGEPHSWAGGHPLMVDDDRYVIAPDGHVIRADAGIAPWTPTDDVGGWV